MTTNDSFRFVNVRPQEPPIEADLIKNYLITLTSPLLVFDLQLAAVVVVGWGQHLFIVAHPNRVVA